MPMGSKDHTGGHWLSFRKERAGGLLSVSQENRRLLIQCSFISVVRRRHKSLQSGNGATLCNTGVEAQLESSLTQKKDLREDCLFQASK